MSKEAMKAFKAFQKSHRGKLKPHLAQTLETMASNCLPNTPFIFNGGNDLLSERNSVSTRQVRNRLLELEKFGLVVRAQKGVWRNRNQKWLLTFELLEEKGGTLLLPIEEERWNSDTEKVEVEYPKGRSGVPERWNSASSMKSLKEIKGESPQHFFNEIRELLPAHFGQITYGSNLDEALNELIQSDLSPKEVAYWIDRKRLGSTNGNVYHFFLQFKEALEALAVRPELARSDFATHLEKVTKESELQEVSDPIVAPVDSALAQEAISKAKEAFLNATPLVANKPNLFK